MRNITEFDERFILKSHSGEYILIYVIISSCVRMIGKFGRTYAPAVSRGGIIFGVFVLHFVLHSLKKYDFIVLYSLYNYRKKYCKTGTTDDTLKIKL